ncbi:hypothetical protein BDF19DRAFT_416992 [Syncephalis fuscata]|nr:hypothetical protein BDF19DRAFT_416992 [Syncephalis fuscata]
MPAMQVVPSLPAPETTPFAKETVNPNHAKPIEVTSRPAAPAIISSHLPNPKVETIKHFLTSALPASPTSNFEQPETTAFFTVAHPPAPVATPALPMTNAPMNPSAAAPAVQAQPINTVIPVEHAKPVIVAPIATTIAPLPAASSHKPLATPVAQTHTPVMQPARPAVPTNQPAQKAPVNKPAPPQVNTHPNLPSADIAMTAPSEPKFMPRPMMPVPEPMTPDMSFIPNRHMPMPPNSFANRPMMPDMPFIPNRHMPMPANSFANRPMMPMMPPQFSNHLPSSFDEMNIRPFRPNEPHNDFFDEPSDRMASDDDDDDDDNDDEDDDDNNDRDNDSSFDDDDDFRRAHWLF